MHTGSCLCGGVQYQISGALEPIQICHCQQCRKAQGGPFASNIPVRRQDFEIVAGHDLLKEFESPTRAGKYRVFCSRCGSPIFSRLAASPELVRLRAGTINEDIPAPIAFHAFVAYKANWWPIAGTAPQYDEFAPSSCDRPA